LEEHVPFLEVISVPAPYDEVLLSTEDSGEAIRPAVFRGAERALKIGARFELDDTELRVGRSPENDLQLYLATMDRYCFRIFRSENRYVYEGGRCRRPLYNGQMFAGTRVIEDNDTFGSGGVFFRYKE
jgi:hypothetical protein